ncbi:acyltransferase family protein [Corynebacterium diphtheriae]|uniref:acyltransferase family protein n=1 Tax=Corynebacterium diphtheriae TaxID=1717 RepID=UPI0002467EF9|nr:acyltransferase family protein [Corynebacterium diphtheriae]AEX76093.1 putative membrane protein [Corynebacterium diphtheriae HC02]
MPQPKTQQSSRPSTTKYRYDLDGLRGIAIAFVVIFHVFVGRVSGGVDVFLLLSGYFFLGSQLRYAAKPNASLNPWWPLWRTIRRLLPALMVVLMSTVLIIESAIPELRTTNVADQVLASAGYYQNWELSAQGSAYGAASSVVSPLQHLWSMSVQGQFYLAAIAFALFVSVVLKLRRRRGHEAERVRHLAGIPLIAVTVASFSYAVYLHPVDQPLNYYSTWSRVWELTLGAVLVLYSDKIRVSRAVGVVFTYLGLAMVLTTGLLFDGAQVFPGPGALYPLGGAALVILGQGHGAGWMKSRFMLWLGSIAYPLYLWHWPLLIMSTIYLGLDRPSTGLGISVIAVSVVLAHLTHKLIEEPFKQHAKRPERQARRVRSAAATLRKATGATRAFAGVVVLALCGTALWIPSVWQKEVQALSKTQLDPVLYPGAMALIGGRVPQVKFAPDPYVLANSLSPAWTDGCMSELDDDPTKIANDNFGEEYCVYGDKNAKKVAYVIGGSHAEQWMAALDQIGRDHGLKIIPIVRQGCPAFATEEDGVFSDDCATFNKVMLEKVRKDKPDLVISNSTRPLLEKLRGLDEVPESYRTLWAVLEKEKIPFIGLRDNPWFLDRDGQAWPLSQCIASGGSITECGKPREEIYSPVDPAARFLKSKTMISIDTADWFCPNGFCPGVIGNIYVYRDGNHISDAYALSLVPLLWEKMEPVVSQL